MLECALNGVTSLIKTSGLFDALTQHLKVVHRQEREHLILADHNLAARKRQIVEQIILIQTMAQRIRDTTEARILLQNFDDTLEVWHVHGEPILNGPARGGSVAVT